MPLPAIVFRTTDALLRWAGVGRPLTWAEHDGVHYNLDTRVTTLESDPSTVVSIASVTTDTAGRDLYVHLTDSTVEGPFALPVTDLNPRGVWAATTFYVVDDIFTASGNVYRAIFPYISPSSFDPGANDGLGHDLYQLYIPLPGNSFPTGGAVGQVPVKSTTLDYAVTWGWKLPTGGSAYQVLLKLSSTNQDADWTTLNAIHVAFSPSTASGLISTDVASALEEIEANIGSGLSGYLPLTGGTLTGVLTLSADPASALQPATKQYVDGIALNLGKRGRVRLVDTSDSDPATSGYTNGATIDSVTIATGDQVLRNASGHQARNGVWVVVASGAASRATEFDTYDEHPGSLIAAEEGTVYADTIWLCTSNAGGTLNTTAISFSQSSATGALLASNNLSDLANAGTARTNLGLGTSATHATGDFALVANNLSDLANAGTARTNLSLGTAATHASTDFQTADAQLFSNIPQNSKSAAYTTVLTDGQKHIFHPSADTTARTFTIDSNANVAYPIGTAITFVNQHSAGVITIAITSDTMRLAGAGTTGSRTLAADGIATALKVTSTEWLISGTGLT
jgi:hypothetical protein